jgi:hypothetical protein
MVLLADEVHELAHLDAGVRLIAQDFAVLSLFHQDLWAKHEGETQQHG